MRALTVALCAALVGCATTPDPRYGRDPAFTAAVHRCDFEAESAAAGGRHMADRIAARIDVRRACMRMMGY